MSALRRPALSRMTVAEFVDWSGDGRPFAHQLVDGEPQAMAPACGTHGTIQAILARLLGGHLVGTGCRVVIAPRVIPRVRAETNVRVPDLAVTCGTDVEGVHAVTEPVLLIEILSPSSEAETRANVWAYATVPSVKKSCSCARRTSPPSCCGARRMAAGRQTRPRSAKTAGSRSTASASNPRLRPSTKARVSFLAADQRRGSMPPKSRPAKRCTWKCGTS
jgi:hypothetical protein